MSIFWILHFKGDGFSREVVNVRDLYQLEVVTMVFVDVTLDFCESYLFVARPLTYVGL